MNLRRLEPPGEYSTTVQYKHAQPIDRLNFVPPKGEQGFSYSGPFETPEKKIDHIIPPFIVVPLLRSTAIPGTARGLFGVLANAARWGDGDPSYCVAMNERARLLGVRLVCFGVVLEGPKGTCCPKLIFGPHFYLLLPRREQHVLLFSSSITVCKELLLPRHARVHELA